MKKYAADSQRLGLDFVPLAFETFGAWGKSAVSTVKSLAELAETNLGVSARFFLRCHTATIAAQLTRSMARFLREMSIKEIFHVDDRGGAARSNHDCAWFAGFDPSAAGLVQWVAASHAVTRNRQARFADSVGRAY